MFLPPDSSAAHRHSAGPETAVPGTESLTLYYDKFLTLLQAFLQKNFGYCDFCISCHKKTGRIFLKNV
jgi:hypothetical protein